MNFIVTREGWRASPVDLKRHHYVSTSEARIRLVLQSTRPGTLYTIYEVHFVKDVKDMEQICTEIVVGKITFVLSTKAALLLYKHVFFVRLEVYTSEQAQSALLVCKHVYFEVHQKVYTGDQAQSVIKCSLVISGQEAIQAPHSINDPLRTTPSN